MGTFASVGMIEGVTKAIGDADNAIGGYRITRTSSASSAGAVTINAYSTLDWESSGLIGIDGCVYTYTGKTLTSFTGISHVKNGAVVLGTAKDHTEEAEIVDLSKVWSALDLLRRSILVDYAEGEYLTALGGNLGVERLPIFKDDDRFREVIKAIAYGPKGTIFGIELALDALVGSGGSYTIIEDLLQYPNTVFISISTAGDDIAQGKTYLNTINYNTIADTGSGIRELEARPATVLSVGSVRLHDLSELFDLRSSIPSAVTYDYYPGAVSPGSAFTYVGTLIEGIAVTANGLYTQITSSDGSATYYRMLDTQGARVTPATECSLSYILKVPSTATLGAVREQCSLAIQDGSKEIAIGITAGAPGQFNLGLYDYAGAGFIGTTFTGNVNLWYEITLKKSGQGTVEFWVDNVLIHEEPYSTWTNSTSNHRIEFGIRATSSAGMRVRTKQLGISLQTATEYWAYQSATGSVSTGSPTLLSDVTASAFVPGDVNKQIVITGSAVSNPQGGNNNGIWFISGYISASVVALTGKQYEASATLAASGRITVDLENAFTYPDDLGKDIVISNSAAGNDGTYVITNLVEAGTGTDFATYDTPGIVGYTNICEVATAFTVEADVDWKLQPNFVTESNLDWELSDAGTLSGGNDLTLRQTLWAQDLIMSMLISDVFSGQLLPDTQTANVLISAGPPVVFEYWPFYLSSTFEEFFDIITVAGVIPELAVGV